MGDLVRDEGAAHAAPLRVRRALRGGGDAGLVERAVDDQLPAPLEQVEQAIRERPQIAEFVDQIRGMVEQGADERIPSGDEIAAAFDPSWVTAAVGYPG